MLRKFKFDYDPDNDSLFLYDPKSKSKASVELDDLIIDYNSRKEITGIEMLNASAFLKDVGCNGFAVTREALRELKGCKVDIMPRSSFFVVKLILLFKPNRQFAAPVIVPSVKAPSPALAY